MVVYIFAEFSSLALIVSGLDFLDLDGVVAVVRRWLVVMRVGQRRCHYLVGHVLL